MVESQCAEMSQRKTPLAIFEADTAIMLPCPTSVTQHQIRLQQFEQVSAESVKILQSIIGTTRRVKVFGNAIQSDMNVHVINQKPINLPEDASTLSIIFLKAKQQKSHARLKAHFFPLSYKTVH